MSTVVLLMVSPVVFLFQSAEGHKQRINTVSQRLEVALLHLNRQRRFVIDLLKEGGVSVLTRCSREGFGEGRIARPSDRHDVGFCHGPALRWADMRLTVPRGMAQPPDDPFVVAGSGGVVLGEARTNHEGRRALLLVRGAEDTTELRLLAETMGITIVETVLQSGRSTREPTSEKDVLRTSPMSETAPSPATPGREWTLPLFTPMQRPVNWSV